MSTGADEVPAPTPPPRPSRLRIAMTFVFSAAFWILGSWITYRDLRWQTFLSGLLFAALLTTYLYWSQWGFKPRRSRRPQ